MHNNSCPVPNILIDRIVELNFTCNSRTGIRRPTVTRIEINPVRTKDKMIEKLRCLPAGDQSRRKPGTKARTMPEN
jgi:hypothetical protein